MPCTVIPCNYIYCAIETTDSYWTSDVKEGSVMKEAFNKIIIIYTETEKNAILDTFKSIYSGEFWESVVDSLSGVRIAR
jgi:hypothetical protein